MPQRRDLILTSINLYIFGWLLSLNYVISNQSSLKVKMFNLTSLWLLLILGLSHHPFSCPLNILPWTRCMGSRWMITNSFSLRHMELKLITALPWIWVLIIYQTKDTFQEFRTMEWDVYWKHNWGLRVLHWLPSHFYPSKESRVQFGSSGRFLSLHVSVYVLAPFIRASLHYG